MCVVEDPQPHSEGSPHRGPCLTPPRQGQRPRSSQLVDSLATGTYHPQPARLVEVPKSSLATRPVAVLATVDRVLFEAVMQRLGPPLDKTLSEEVFSARLKHDMKRPGIGDCSSR